MLNYRNVGIYQVLTMMVFLLMRLSTDFKCSNSCAVQRQFVERLCVCAYLCFLIPFSPSPSICFHSPISRRWGDQRTPTWTFFLSLFSRVISFYCLSYSFSYFSFTPIAALSCSCRSTSTHLSTIRSPFRQRLVDAGGIAIDLVSLSSGTVAAQRTKGAPHLYCGKKAARAWLVANKLAWASHLSLSVLNVPFQGLHFALAWYNTIESIALYIRLKLFICARIHAPISLTVSSLCVDYGANSSKTNRYSFAL